MLFTAVYAQVGGVPLLLPLSRERIVRSSSNQEIALLYHIFFLECSTPDRQETDWPPSPARAIVDALRGYY